MSLRYYAAIQNEVPLELLVSIMGPVDCEANIFYTRDFASKTHLATLVGTLQSRMERGGLDFKGALILPYGAKIPGKKAKFKVRGPLKCRMDYGVFPEPYPILEMRSPYNEFYAAEQEPLDRSDTVVIQPNAYYPKGLTGKDVQIHYHVTGSRILAQYEEHKLDVGIILRVDDRTLMRRQASNSYVGAKIDPTYFEQMNRGRTVEFYLSFEANAKHATIKVMPKPDFPWEDTTEITEALCHRMANLEDPDILGVDLRFAGDGGFYITARFVQSLDASTIRDVMNGLIAQYVRDARDPRMVTRATKAPHTVHIGHVISYRAAYSLAHTTGLVSVPVALSQLRTFRPTDATISSIIKVADFEEEYRPTAVEKNALRAWLTKDISLTGADIKVILQYYSRVPFSIFSFYVNDLGGWHWEPEQIDRTVDGLTSLLALPKYQAAAFIDPLTGEEHAEKPDIVDFLKQHKMVPIWPRKEDPAADSPFKYSPTWEEVLMDSALAQLQFLVDMQSQVDPLTLQQHINVGTGIKVPIDDLGEFIELVKKVIGAKQTRQAGLLLAATAGTTKFVVSPAGELTVWPDPSRDMDEKYFHHVKLQEMWGDAESAKYHGHPVKNWDQVALEEGWIMGRLDVGTSGKRYLYMSANDPERALMTIPIEYLMIDHLIIQTLGNYYDVPVYSDDGEDAIEAWKHKDQRVAASQKDMELGLEMDDIQYRQDIAGSRPKVV